jgi:hypothetical protein
VTGGAVAGKAVASTPAASAFDIVPPGNAGSPGAGSLSIGSVIELPSK